MNFDPIASFYDQLARLIFGQSITKSQICHLHVIQPGSKVLITGGGTGWILDHLSDDCEYVTYAESSGKMMSRSRARRCAFNIEYIQEPLEDITLNHDYDVVITNFFLDIYENAQLKPVTEKLAGLLKDDGLWICTDFVDNGKWWQRSLIKTMYAFFRLTTGMRNNDIPDWRRSITDSGMEEQKAKIFYKGFIHSIWYRKLRSGISA